MDRVLCWLAYKKAYHFIKFEFSVATGRWSMATQAAGHMSNLQHPKQTLTVAAKLHKHGRCPLHWWVGGSDLLTNSGIDFPFI